ncbi:hypothetical protein BJ165DRAFT_146382 [Panaeolus papilionaceus]|nr:hypothetical protein BJ165DRAFT_146382 [Panaeolus papilionaceus]
MMLAMLAHAMEEFGSSHPEYRRVPWPHDLLDCSINLPQSLIQPLTNNEPISYQQTNLIHDLKSTLPQKIESSSARIQQLEKEIAQLKHDNKAYRKQLYAYDTMLSPFRRLSNDTLYHISTHLPPIESSDICSIASHSAYAVSQVSQSWRRTVHNISSLWTTVQVDCSHRYLTIKPLTNRVEHYSLLSASKPLTVQLDSSSGNDEELEDADAVVRMLTWMFTL